MGSYFCLNGKFYKNQVFEGFSQLQQNNEFVDMTLAAEGHFVKVHKTLLALASPYLKALLQSAPCQHPVLFLNDISHEVLCFLLEYIYRGEVRLPCEKLSLFLKAAHALHISGLNNFIPPPTDNDKPRDEKQAQYITEKALQRPSTVEANIAIAENVYDLQIIPPVSTTNNGVTGKSCPEPCITNLPTVLNNDPNENFTSFSVVNTENETTVNNSKQYSENISQGTIGEIDVASIANLDIIGNNNENNNTLMNIESQLTECEQPYDINIVNENVSTTSNVEIGSNIKIQILNGNKQSELSDLINITNDVQLPQDSGVPIEFNMNDLLKCNNVSLTNPNTTKNPAVCEANHEHNIESISKEPASVTYSITSRGSLQLITEHFMYYCHYKRDMGRKRRWRCIDYRGSRCLAAIDTTEERIVEKKQKHNHPNHDSKIWKRVMRSKVFCCMKEAEEYGKNQMRPKLTTVNTDEVVTSE